MIQLASLLRRKTEGKMYLSSSGHKHPRRVMKQELIHGSGWMNSTDRILYSVIDRYS